jgi:excisionase family DNA binding protein
MESLLTIRQLSELTQLSVGSLYHFVSQQRIPVVRISARCLRFRKADIEAWIADRVVEPSDRGAWPNNRQILLGKRKGISI